jgi:entericidin B
MAPVRKFTLLIAAAMLGLLAACNTMEGLGQDIERGGENLQESAQDTKKKM